MTDVPVGGGRVASSAPEDCQPRSLLMDQIAWISSRISWFESCPLTSTNQLTHLKKSGVWCRRQAALVHAGTKRSLSFGFLMTRTGPIYNGDTQACTWSASKTGWSLT